MGWKFEKCLSQVKNLNFKNHESEFDQECENDEIMIVYVQYINLKDIITLHNYKLVFIDKLII